MQVDDFLQLAQSLPEALILLGSDGNIVAANHKAMKFLCDIHHEPVGKHLIEFLVSDQKVLDSALRIWKRSRTPIPARIKWKEVASNHTTGMQCQGFLLQPATKSSPAQLVLRCLPGRSDFCMSPFCPESKTQYREYFQTLSVSLCIKYFIHQFVNPVFFHFAKFRF